MKRIASIISISIILLALCACGSRSAYDRLSSEQRTAIDVIYENRNKWESQYTVLVSRATYDGKRAFSVQDIDSENTEGSYGWKKTYCYDENSITCVESDYIGYMLAFMSDGSRERVVPSNWSPGSSEFIKKDRLARILFLD